MKIYGTCAGCGKKKLLVGVAGDMEPVCEACLWKYRERVASAGEVRPEFKESLERLMKDHEGLWRNLASCHDVCSVCSECRRPCNPDGSFRCSCLADFRAKVEVLYAFFALVGVALAVKIITLLMRGE